METYWGTECVRMDECFVCTSLSRSGMLLCVCLTFEELGDLIDSAVSVPQFQKQG